MSGEWIPSDAIGECVGGPLDGQPVDAGFNASDHMICITQHGCHIYRLADGRYVHKEECSQRNDELFGKAE